MLKLIQVRKCDGQCCKESPRFPDENGNDCIYRDPRHPEKGCTLQIDSSLIPEGRCPVMTNMSAEEAFINTCLRWPQETGELKLGETGGCCWQVVNNDD